MPHANTLIGGRYRLGSVLGSGGSGRVWRAWDHQLEREVAIKEVVFPAAVSSDERALITSRAMREARNAARLDHPNVVTTYDVLAEEGQPWIVMRLVEGRSLERLVVEEGPLSPQEVARMGLQLLDAIDAAHRAGVLHRDIKPSNVMVTEDGTALLADFSIATAVDSETVTGTGVLLGSPGFIAPERLDNCEAGPPSDLFGFGATLYFAVEGERPFERRGEPMSVLFATATRPHRRPLRAEALEDVLDGLLEKDPAKRFDVPRTRAALLAAADGTPTMPLGLPPLIRSSIIQSGLADLLAHGDAGEAAKPKRPMSARLKRALRWSVGVTPTGWLWYRPALASALLALLIVITQFPRTPQSGGAIGMPTPILTVSSFASGELTSSPSAEPTSTPEEPFPTGGAPVTNPRRTPRSEPAVPPPVSSAGQPSQSPSRRQGTITSAVLTVQQAHFTGLCEPTGTPIQVIYTMTITSSEPGTRAHIMVTFGNGDNAQGNAETDANSTWSGTFSYVYSATADSAWRLRFRAANPSSVKPSNPVQITVDCTNL